MLEIQLGFNPDSTNNQCSFKLIIQVLGLHPLKLKTHYVIQVLMGWEGGVTRQLGTLRNHDDENAT